jgi:hypothetical protein
MLGVKYGDQKMHADNLAKVLINTTIMWFPELVGPSLTDERLQKIHREIKAQSYNLLMDTREDATTIERKKFGVIALAAFGLPKKAAHARLKGARGG